MPFALYEAGGEDETFIFVERTQRYDEIDDLSRKRQRERMDNGNAPILEQLLVPKETVDFPLHAEKDDLLAMIRANRDLYPNTV